MLQGWTIVISFFMPAILFFTVIAAVGVGVLTAYLAVFGILSTFRQAPQPVPAPSRPRLVLVASQNHASGD